MRITNRTRNTLLGARVKLASTWFSRLRGFIGRPEPNPGEGILLNRCNAVHTFWMSFDLDVVFLSEKGMVLELIRSLRPWKRTMRVPEAEYVLEIPAGMIDVTGTRIGDELTWREPAPYSISILSGDRGSEAASSAEGGRRTG